MESVRKPLTQASENLDIQCVALIGPIAELNAPASGGRESSNRRLLSLYENIGIRVVELAYPSVKNANKAFKLISYISRFVFIAKQIKKLESRSVVHFTPLTRRFILCELVLIKLLNKFGLRVILDLRGGTHEKDFNGGRRIYRWMYTQLLSASHLISVEGKTYLKFIGSLTQNIPIHYLPNFIEADSIRENNAKRSSEKIKLIYIGAVNEDKGLVASTNVAKHLANNGYQIEFSIIGLAKEKFKKELQDLSSKAAWLKFKGTLDFKSIKEELSTSNFFLFLTHWQGEGHSNALTEAMGQGVIPVTTNQGFCREVIGSDGICIMDRDETVAIAKAIEDQVNNPAEMLKRSQSLVQLVTDRYSSDAVKLTLLEMLEGVSKQNHLTR